MQLVDFLLQRLDEDEAVARAASPSPWQYGDVGSVAGGSLYDATRMIGGVDYEQPTDHDGTIVRHLLVAEANANGAHIARHDPARVLADVKAKRAILEWHESWPVMVETPPEITHDDPSDMQSMTFRMSRQIAWLTTQEYRARFGDEPPSSPMLRALAAVYSDHPDYDATWAL